MDGVASTLASILIHDEVDDAMVGFHQGRTLDHITALELMTVNSSDSAFSCQSGKNPHI